ncbi:MAG: PhoH family protein, partial [Prevotellaceae bacterium]|nr:PhoH family protein [Prevotellaceae bacterium]
MTEQIFNLSEHTDTSIFYGVNNKNMQLIKDLNPGVKIVARGHTIKIVGDEESVKKIGREIEKVEQFALKNNSLSEDNIIKIVKGDAPAEIKYDNLILHGINGKSIMARTKNQQKLVTDFETNDLLFAIG